MSLRLYVICHDDESERHARETWGAHGWARVLRLDNRPPRAVLREGAAYVGAIRDLEHEWRDVDFVGAVSWKVVDKIGLGPGEVMRIAKRHRGAADVVAFYPLDEPLLEHAASCHPRFSDAWQGCLGALGYAPDQVTSAHMPYFVCNYWMASPTWMAAYTAWLARLVEVMDTEPGVQDALWADAAYPTDLPEERLRELYGRPYLPHHGFIVERAPCFFFWHHGARIAYR